MPAVLLHRKPVLKDLFVGWVQKTLAAIASDAYAEISNGETKKLRCFIKRETVCARKGDQHKEEYSKLKEHIAKGKPPSFRTTPKKTHRG